jgi:hypothetical protein
MTTLPSWVCLLAKAFTLQNLWVRRFFIIPDYLGQPEPLSVRDGLAHVVAKCADGSMDLLWEKWSVSIITPEGS